MKLQRQFRMFFLPVWLFADINTLFLIISDLHLIANSINSLTESVDDTRLALVVRSLGL